MARVALVETARTLADPVRGWAPTTRFAIIADDLAVGEIVLRHGTDDWLIRFAGQIGYSVDPAHRGQGYAAAAVGALLPVARRAGMDVLWATCSPINVASRRTLEKAGAALVETVVLPPGCEMYVRGERHKLRYRLMVPPA